MATYKHKRLFSQVTRSPVDESESYESIWAYYVKFEGSDNSVPGRFRIRVNRVSNKDFVQILNPNVDTDDVPEGSMLSGQLDKWSDRGWIPCLDWIGDPESATINSIEKDLVSQFEMFTLGSSENSSEWVAPPETPAKPKKKIKSVVRTENTDKDTGTDPDDLDWL